MRGVGAVKPHPVRSLTFEDEVIWLGVVMRFRPTVLNAEYIMRAIDVDRRDAAHMLLWQKRPACFVHWSRGQLDGILFRGEPLWS